ncbi:MAG: hypothetical protein JF591_13685 [Lysobacter sp.]|nr:hypothetical protein [Lysobacter sp.]
MDDKFNHTPWSGTVRGEEETRFGIGESRLVGTAAENAANMLQRNTIGGEPPVNVALGPAPARLAKTSGPPWLTSLNRSSILVRMLSV